jgi:hypothetical protein
MNASRTLAILFLIGLVSSLFITPADAARRPGNPTTVTSSDKAVVSPA